MRLQYVRREVLEVEDRSIDRRNNRSMERLALRNKVKSEKHLIYIRGNRRRDRIENVFAWTNGLCENAATAISCRGPALARKNKRGIPVAGRRK